MEQPLPRKGFRHHLFVALDATVQGRKLGFPFARTLPRRLKTPLQPLLLRRGQTLREKCPRETLNGTASTTATPADTAHHTTDHVQRSGLSHSGTIGNVETEGVKPIID